ncbi:GCS-domain-containing protein [Martensiomyces pterosporus]|nr:GCS-domain-containing protein [Martensiomyces pterosporus]
MTRIQSQVYSWQEILPRMDEIRSQATDQFIAAWSASQSNQVHDFVWHETMGYVVVKCNEEAKSAVLSPRAPEILGELGCIFDPTSLVLHPQVPDSSQSNSRGPEDTSQTCWRPGHARFAMRCAPTFLRSFSVQQLVCEVPESLCRRRRVLKDRLQPDEMLLSISQYPLLGVGEYIADQGPAGGPLLRSKLLSDNALNPIPPFTLEIDGIVDRRGNVPYTAVPVFHDRNTEWPFIDTSLPPIAGYSASSQDHNTDRDSACMVSVDSVPLPGGGGGGASDAKSASTPEGASVAAAAPAATTASDGDVGPELAPAENCLLLDSPLFGIGSGGVLRITLCAADLEEARILYDHLAPISAIMMALTAATPIVKGHLTDRDCYWDVQCSAVDDRSAQERGIVPLTTAKGTLLKSRFGSVDSYLGPGPKSDDLAFRPEFNDCQYTYDNDSYWKMKEGGVDRLLAQHVAHLFIRDLHYASERMLKEKEEGANSDSDGQEHFKRFLGCNRQNVCLYPPNIRTGSGWEVEFMTLEVQLTDEENAAFITFMVLLSRAILSYRLNLYLPISLMDQNMARAQKANAACDQLFYFRRDPFSGRDGKSGGSGRISRREKQEPNAWSSTYASTSARGGSSGLRNRPAGTSSHTLTDSSPDTAEYVELTVDEIMNGSRKYRVVGLLNVIHSYLNSLHLEYDVEIRLRQQLSLVEKRASGKLSTLAAWMRKFVRSHPDYRHDSVVPPSTNYDLLKTMNDIEEGRIKAPDLLG